MYSNKYWFVPKLYSWGFVPISWEGWLLTLVLIFLLLISIYTNNFDNSNITIKEGLRFLLDLFFTITIFSHIAKPRTKGGVRWRWGK